MNTTHGTSINLDILAKLKLPPITQLGFIVQSIDESARFYGSLFNIRKWYMTQMVESEYRFRGTAIDMSIDIAVGYSGKMQVELIQVRGNDNNVYYEYLGREGFGFHHFGVVVGNLEKYKERMVKAGIQPLQEGTLKYGGGGGTRFAYMDTMGSSGCIVELIETKAFGLNFGMPQWLVSLGRITGDTASIKV